MEIVRDIDKFFDDCSTPLYIWGAGNAGFWIGHYLDRCNYDYEGFIDKNISNEERKFKDITGKKKISHPVQLNRFTNKSMRILIASQNAEDVLKDICMFISEEKKAIVLYPFSLDVTETKTETYNINDVLAYFRKRIINKPVPSVLSNNCGAGFIYRMLGVKEAERKSPTVSSVIFSDDYIKLLYNPKKYLSKKIKYSHWTSYWGTCMPVGRIDDIQVLFIHDRDENEPIKRWNALVENIDFSNLFFLFEDHMYRIPDKDKRRFLETDFPHLLVLQNDCIGELSGRKDVLLTHNAHLHIRGSAIENFIDLPELLNLM